MQLSLNDTQKVISVPVNMEGVQTLEKECLSDTIPKQAKLVAINELFSLSEQDAWNIVLTWQYSLSYLKNQRLNGCLDLLQELIKGDKLTALQKLTTTTTIHNNGHIMISLSMFERIALDEKTETIYRIEACKYLYAVPEFKDKILQILVIILKDYSLSPKKRYEIIKTFNFKNGISTYLNSQKLILPKDPEFTSVLLKTYFLDKNNPHEYIITAGQALLQLYGCTTSEKHSHSCENQISHVLLEFAKSEELPDEIRAKAADVLQRMSPSTRVEALAILNFLGKRNKKLCTIYENEQNAHDESVTESVMNFVESVVDEVMPTKTYEQVCLAIKELSESNPRGKFNDSDRITNSLERLEWDEATFTRYNVSLAQFLVLLWEKIRVSGLCRYELEQRLLQELSDMGDGCSSGDLSKLVNVVPGAVKISWEEQIKSNMIGRFGAILKDMTIKEQESGYREQALTELEKLKEELYKEFVLGGYITENKFEECVKMVGDMIIDEWLD